MINIFVICYHFITNSYSKVKGLVLPEAGDVNAPSANDEHSVRSSNEGIDTNGTTNNITIKSIFKNILSFFQGDKSKSKESLPPTSDTMKLELKINSDEVIKQVSIIIEKCKEHRHLRDKLITQAFNKLESISNLELSEKLPEECINYFISIGLPEEKAKLVTPEIFRSLIATPDSSVRSVFHTLRKADKDDIKQEKINNFIGIYTYNQELFRHMSFETFDTTDRRYQVPQDQAQTIQQYNAEQKQATVDTLKAQLSNTPTDNIFQQIELTCHILAELNIPPECLKTLPPEQLLALVGANTPNIIPADQYQS